MRNRSWRRVFVVAVAAAAAAQAAVERSSASPGSVSVPGPPCPQGWMPVHGGAPGTDNAVESFATFDDGNGLALYVGGRFGSACGVEAKGVARWDGTRWSPLGTGIVGQVYAMAEFDDGTGPALYAGGFFQTAGGSPAANIARWNGSTWSPLGSGIALPSAAPHVRALAVFDDGSGPALYAGGRFSTAGATPSSHVARWNGSSWSAVGNGFDAPVQGLLVFDDGSGPALYASGTYTASGATPLGHLARWNGSSWSQVGGGFASPTGGLCAFDDGSGPVLCVAEGTSSTASRVWRWDGALWSPLGDFDGSVGPLASFDDGSGPELVVCGRFAHANGVNASNAARWDGTGWSPLGSGLVLGVLHFVGVVASIDLGTGPRLVVGGGFGNAGGVPVLNVALWSGTSWSAIASGLDGALHALAVYDDGSGAKLHAAGEFVSASDGIVNRVAAWNGTRWSPLGTGITGPFGGAAWVHALAVHDDGGGSALYAGGTLGLAGGASANSVARWNGASWSGVPTGSNPTIHALAEFDEGGGPALFAGGIVSGTPSFPFLMRWNGTAWSSPGTGLGNGYQVRALFAWDDGTGPELYVGGTFSDAGGVAAANVASWDGTSWKALGSGTNGEVASFAAFDDGSGPALYVGGSFTSAGGVAAPRIARWNGTSWTALGTGIGTGNDSVTALATFDDGGGAALYAGGRFTIAGGTQARNIARWNGTTWSPLGAGVGARPIDRVDALLDFDDGARRLLRVGGSFDASPAGDSYLAAWGCTQLPPGTPTCPGDGSLPIPCPCANSGAPGLGCASSVSPAGARLTAIGATAPDRVALLASGMPASGTAMYVKGDLSSPNGIVFGDGVRCAAGTLIRLRARTSVGGGSQFPDSTDTVTLSVRGGTPVGSGASAHYLVYYHDAAAFCTPATFNASNGYTIVW